MKTQRSILIAFLLNLFFAVAEFIGGFLTGSVAISSDALHDLGDAVSIGISYALEKKSNRPPDKRYSFGYGRYSVIGGAITTLILLLGSVGIIIQASLRLYNPIEIHHEGMLWMAIGGLLVNGSAAWITHGAHTVNEKAVNLHMLEDVLGWIIILIGSLIIKFTGWIFLDPMLSIAVALFILSEAIKNLHKISHIILERTPDEMDPDMIIDRIKAIAGIEDAYHLHIWSMDGNQHCATLHLVATNEQAKKQVRSLLKEMNIMHATIETDTPGSSCHTDSCNLSHKKHHHCHHHH